MVGRQLQEISQQQVATGLGPNAGRQKKKRRKEEEEEEAKYLSQI